MAAQERSLTGGASRCAQFLQETLVEEDNANLMLTEIAESIVNLEAETAGAAEYSRRQAGRRYPGKDALSKNAMDFLTTDYDRRIFQ